MAISIFKNPIHVLLCANARVLSDALDYISIRTTRCSTRNELGSTLKETLFTLCVTDDLRTLIAIRDLDKEIPVLFVSSSNADDIMVLAFESGADDIISMPLAPKEFMCRLQALARRSTIRIPESADVLFKLGDYLFDAKERTLTISGMVSMMTPGLATLLRYFCLNKGRVISCGQLADAFWGDQQESIVDKEAGISNAVVKLRKELRSDSRVVLSVIKTGYYRLTVEE